MPSNFLHYPLLTRMRGKSQNASEFFLDLTYLTKIMLNVWAMLNTTRAPRKRAKMEWCWVRIMRNVFHKNSSLCRLFGRLWSYLRRRVPPSMSNFLYSTITVRKIRLLRGQITIEVSKQLKYSGQYKQNKLYFWKQGRHLGSWQKLVQNSYTRNFKYKIFITVLY